MNTAILLLVNINTCSLPLHHPCRGPREQAQRSWAPSPHHPSQQPAPAPPELSEHSRLALLCTAIFFTLEVYSKVWIRFYRVWLLVTGLTSCSFVSLQKQNSQQFLVQWFYDSIFALEAECAGLNSEAWRRPVRLRDWWTGHRWHSLLDRRT